MLEDLAVDVLGLSEAALLVELHRAVDVRLELVAKGTHGWPGGAAVAAAAVGSAVARCFGGGVRRATSSSGEIEIAGISGRT